MNEIYENNIKTKDSIFIQNEELFNCKRNLISFKLLKVKNQL